MNLVVPTSKNIETLTKVLQTINHGFNWVCIQIWALPTKLFNRRHPVPPHWSRGRIKRFVNVQAKEWFGPEISTMCSIKPYRTPWWPVYLQRELIPSKKDKAGIPVQFDNFRSWLTMKHLKPWQATLACFLLGLLFTGAIIVLALVFHTTKGASHVHHG